MKVAIIDDERLARVALRRLLNGFPDLQVVAEATNVADGVRAVEHSKPELLFLDTQMPDGSGFDPLAKLQWTPAVIFTTAYSQHALRAFEVNALEPIEPQRLRQALQKAGRETAPPRQRPATAEGKFFIQDGERCWLVAPEQIVLFESEGNYTRVCFEQNQPLLLRSLNQIEARLDPSHFMRVNRKQIVNLRFVTAVGPSALGGLTLTLQGGHKVAMSRRRAALFKQASRL